MALSKGSRLGPYEIVSALGAGGMGEVYRARDARLGRDVAVKVLPPAFSADRDRLRRFEQEARAAGHLNHPNVLAIYDVGTHEGSPYVVAELLEGETLRDVVAGGAIPLRKAIDYARQTAEGLAAAHDTGIVHRDLKPENLFLTRDGRVKILDFGLAKLTHPDPVSEPGAPATTGPTETESGAVMGTVGYMSPEQLRGKRVDYRSDIFAFGAILYELLSGRRAFHGDSVPETMNAILKDDPPELAASNPKISPGLERVVRRCLEKKPEARFQSTRDLAFALEALSAPSGVVGPPLVAAPAPRIRRRSAAIAVALTLLAVGPLLYLESRLGGKSPPPTYRRLTFRRGKIDSARFAPDGQTIIYGAAWEGDPIRLYSTRLDSRESSLLDLPQGRFLSISSSGELAITVGAKGTLPPSDRPDRAVAGTLARVSLAGGAPRELLKGVLYADWSPDGKDLAVIRRSAPEDRSTFRWEENSMSMKPMDQILVESGSHPTAGRSPSSKQLRRRWLLHSRSSTEAVRSKSLGSFPLAIR